MFAAYSSIISYCELGEIISVGLNDSLLNIVYMVSRPLWLFSSPLLIVYIQLLPCVTQYALSESNTLWIYHTNASANTYLPGMFPA